MSKSTFNIQDQYLNQARKERVKVQIRLTTGEMLEGLIKSFDNFSILMDNGGDQLLYKHAIVTINSASGHFRLNSPS
jgi:host factor-I protein